MRERDTVQINSIITTMSDSLNPSDLAEPVPADAGWAPLALAPGSLWLEQCGWCVPAGFPSPAADHTRQRIDLNTALIRNQAATYLFRVKGDSMMGAGIYEGDTLLVDRSIDPQHNHIVLALLNNEFTVKRFYRRGGVVKLLAENSIYPPRLVREEDDFVVWGVVTYNLHKLC